MKKQNKSFWKIQEEMLDKIMDGKKEYPNPNKGKYVYCSECWNKLDNEVCFCLYYSRQEPYFCGNCNHHVSGISSRKMNPIIKMLKKSKIELPYGIGSYSWD